MRNIHTYLARVLRDFIETESASGIVMLLAGAVALLLANSMFAPWYQALIATPVKLGYGDVSAIEPASAWVKDILMVLFFLVVGMELKHEMREGFLAKRDQMLLPLAAAVGGMLVPALLFLGLNHADPVARMGWAIPSATDIAFALCILTLVGPRIPRAAKIFLLAIAIFDDLGAILIIAGFYSTALSLLPLALGALGIGILIALNRCGVARLAPYLLTGIWLWFCLHLGGIHTTIAGVAVGMAIPLRVKGSDYSPLNRCLEFLHPWVSFLILPLFAFTSAGVSFAEFRFVQFAEPIPLGIMLGLFAGKQIGIFCVTAFLIQMRWVQRPEGVSWGQLYGISVLAGIGFTMSLFIDLLAFNAPGVQEMSKMGILAGSLISAIWGFIVLRYLAKAKQIA